MANYLVTGAAGFIGDRVCRELIAEGHTVLGLDNLNASYDVRLKQWRLDRLLKLDHFSFYQQDICDRQLLIEKCSAHAPFDAIIHLAARAGVRQSVEDPWAFLETNTIGTLNLLDLSIRMGIPKFVLASTSSIYGENPPLPTPEEAESSRPLQPYAASKKAAEVLAHTYHYLHGLDVTVFRYFTVYGPAGRPDLAMFRFVQWIAEGRSVHIYGDGNQSRGFTYVDDIAIGTIAGLKPMGYEIINLGGHQTISINDLVVVIERLIGKQARVIYSPRVMADVSANWANVEKARQLLGWQPQVSLEEGIPRLVEWYMQERSWAAQVLTP